MAGMAEKVVSPKDTSLTTLEFSILKFNLEGL